MKLCSILKIACLAGFFRETTAFTSSGFRRQAAGLIGISSRRSMIGPMETSDLMLADDEGVIKVVAISLTLGGGLIPALISANKAMFTALSGRKESDADENVDAGDTLDPTVGEKNKKYRQYVYDSGSSGPDMPLSGLLLASDRIPVADLVAVLGRIQDVNTLADWKNLPSAKLPGTSKTNPPMWLPRKAFKGKYIHRKFYLNCYTATSTLNCSTNGISRFILISKSMYARRNSWNGQR